MSENVSAKAVRINIKQPVYCKLLTDATEGTTYGPVKKLGKAMQVQLTPSVSTGVLYGDGNQTENIAMLNAIAMAMDINKIAIEDKAEVLGHEYKNGILNERAGAESPYIAVGYIVEQTNGKEEYVWLLKGKAQPMNDSVAQKADNITFSTDSITINFIPRESDKLLKFYGDTANPDFTKAMADKFFTNGPASPVAP